MNVVRAGCKILSLEKKIAKVCVWLRPPRDEPTGTKKLGRAHKGIGFDVLKALLDQLLVAVGSGLCGCCGRGTCL